MSTNYANIIPLNEKYVPGAKLIELITNIIEKRNKGNLKVIIEKNNSVRFYDCGENFEYILCPFCKRELDIKWWQHEMDKAYELWFSKMNLITPCCNKNSSLNELDYSFPQGFAMFAIKIEDYEPEKLVIDDTLFSQLRDTSNERWKVVQARY